MEDWKEAFKMLKRQFGYWYSDGKEYEVCPVCGIDIRKLEDFIEQELLKAREEVLREVLDKSRDLSMLHLNPHIRTSDVEEMLSKLTTK